MVLMCTADLKVAVIKRETLRETPLHEEEEERERESGEGDKDV